MGKGSATSCRFWSEEVINDDLKALVGCDDSFSWIGEIAPKRYQKREGELRKMFVWWRQMSVAVKGDKNVGGILRKMCGSWPREHIYLSSCGLVVLDWENIVWISGEESKERKLKRWMNTRRWAYIFIYHFFLINKS